MLVAETSTKKSMRIIYVVNTLSLNKHFLNQFLVSRHTEMNNSNTVSAFRKLWGYIRLRGKRSAYNI